MMKFSHLRSVFAQERNLPWFCALVAALVAAWVNYQARGVINNDGVLYLEVARLFGEGQWREGVATYNWPLYPLLIMAVHKVSSLGLQLSANLLTVLFFAATAMGMATLIRDLGGSRQTMIAGLVLLIATPYLVGNILPMVAREHGYWASFIWSMVFFLRFSDQPTWKKAVSWGALAIICVLFRIEGLTYLVAIPLVLLVDTSISLMHRLQKFAKANAVLIALGTSLAVLLMVHPTLQLSDFGRLGDPFMIAELVYQQVTSGLSVRAEVIGQQALGRFLDDYGMPVLLLGMLYIIVAKAFTVGGILQSGLAMIFWKKTKEILNVRYRRFLVWLLILGLINAAVIMVKGFVLPKRLLSPIGLAVIIMAAFGVNAFIEEARNKTAARTKLKTWFIPALAILLLIQTAAVLWPAAQEKRYERDAVEWLLSHSLPGSRAYFQTNRLRFYAGLPMHRKEDWVAIQHSRWKEAVNVRSDKSKEENLKDIIVPQGMESYDYFLFSLGRKSLEQESMLTGYFGKPLAVFEGPRGNRVLIYENHK